MAGSKQKTRCTQRDLSWLSFNARVLEEANSPQVPLLEKIKFLAIFANNLDEFFMVRVANLQKLLFMGFNKKDRFGYLPYDLHLQIKKETYLLRNRLYAIQKKLLIQLEKNKIRLRKYFELDPEQRKYVRKYFEATLYPTLTPMAIDQGRPFPLLPSKTLAFAVTLKRFKNTHLVVIPLPKILPRLLRLPSEQDEFNFILIEEILRSHLASFFKGYKMTGISLFRVIRDSELIVDEELTPDLLKAIDSEVKNRRRAKVVSLEVERACPPELLELLCLGLDFPGNEVTKIISGFDLTYNFELAKQTALPRISYPAYLPAKLDYANIFDKIQQGDILLHLPYQSFQPTIDLLQTAARDENVLAIKLTLYRTDEKSAIITALKDAAKNKKQVTVLVEIKARFDEERNITWAKELEDAGCHVMYGIAGMKVHSKMLLIIRKEDERIRRYVHLSTGNYNENTARVYTDLSYFTVNEDFGRDISDIFNFVTGCSMPSNWQRVVSAPNDLRDHFFTLIDNEIAFQKKHKNGRIFAKFNSLEDLKIIEKLYQASQAGVEVDLIVRGMCCLIPGVKG
ncbi:MAG: polyphosphate kinase 1, partial [Candidatus Margulisiibacteriota bacterium]